MNLQSILKAAVFSSTLVMLHCAEGSEGNGEPYGAGAAGSLNTAPGFTLLIPPMGPPLDPQGGTPLTPPPPEGWVWYPIDGAICRDGSPAGLFARFTSSNKLFIYFEGGGACTNLGFCNFNPQSVNKAISGDGQSVLGSALGVVDARQQPGVFSAGLLQGVFDCDHASRVAGDFPPIFSVERTRPFTNTCFARASTKARPARSRWRSSSRISWRARSSRSGRSYRPCSFIASATRQLSPLQSTRRPRDLRSARSR